MRTVKSMLKVMAVVILSLVCVLFAYALRRAPVFEEGIAYEFYRGTSSAEIVLSENPALTKLFAVDIRGESVRYAGDRYEEIAEEFFITKYHLTRIFKEATGHTVNEYIRTKRLRYVEELSEDGECTLSEAAIKAGYKDYSSFYRAYKDAHGTPPKKDLKKKINN